MNCWHCGHALIWGGDHDFEDYGKEDEGIVSNFSCPDCGAYVEVYLNMEQKIKKTDRSPNQIRDHAVRCFNQLAPKKYDDGQARKEITDNLDQHPDLIGAIREELIDAFFYNESLAAQRNAMEAEIDQLKQENARLKEMVSR